MGCSGSQEVLRKNQIFCCYRNRSPDFSAGAIYNVPLFIIIFVNDFKLTGFEFELMLSCT